MISWVKIDDHTKLPKEEVIALKESTEEIAIGFLDDNEGVLVCDEEYSILEWPTHYILKKDMINLLI